MDPPLPLSVRKRNPFTLPYTKFLTTTTSCFPISSRPTWWLFSSTYPHLDNQTSPNPTLETTYPCKRGSGSPYQKSSRKWVVASPKNLPERERRMGLLPREGKASGVHTVERGILVKIPAGGSKSEEEGAWGPVVWVQGDHPVRPAERRSRFASASAGRAETHVTDHARCRTVAFLPAPRTAAWLLGTTEKEVYLGGPRSCCGAMASRLGGSLRVLRNPSL